jgi:hypothetical protein
MLAGRPHEAVGNGSPRWMAVGPRSRGCTEPGLQAGSPLTPALACACAVMIVPWRTLGARQPERTSRRRRHGPARWHRGTGACRCPSPRRSSRARAVPESPSGAARPRSGPRRRNASDRGTWCPRFARLHRCPRHLRAAAHRGRTPPGTCPHPDRAGAMRGGSAVTQGQVAKWKAAAAAHYKAQGRHRGRRKAGASDLRVGMVRLNQSHASDRLDSGEDGGDGDGPGPAAA